MISSSFTNTPGLPILQSKDLVNWKVIAYALENLPLEKYKEPLHGCGVWAPSIRYHNNLYYICFPMPDDGIFMTMASDIRGPWSTPVNIFPGSGYIDPCPFWDDDGRAYLVYGVAKSRIGFKSKLFLTEMSPDGMSAFGNSKVVFDGNNNGQDTVEGPKLYKRNGYYYIFAPAGGVKSGWQLALRSENIYGPYEHRIVMMQEDTCINGPHQGAWIDTPFGEDWFIHFEDVYAAGRIIHLQPLKWVNDWPVIGEPVQGKHYGKPVYNFRKPKTGVNTYRCEPDADDDFWLGDKNTAWQWNANHENDWIISDGVNGLKLRAIYNLPGTPIGNMPNLLMQKWPAPEFSAIFSIDIENLTESTRCGIVNMGVEYGVLELEKNAGVIMVSFIEGKQIFGNILLEDTREISTIIEKVDKSVIKDDEIHVVVKIQHEGMIKLEGEKGEYPLQKVYFYYCFRDNDYKFAGCVSAMPGRWVGDKIGVYATADRNDIDDFLKVNSVKFKK